MKGISKRFDTVQALNSVDFSLNKGEIHALLGENGAGKTTLMNILHGFHQPDEGEIYINGELMEFKDSLNAIKAGIGMVNQHFMLVPVLSVTENVVAGAEPTKGIFFDFKRAVDEVESLAKENGFNISAKSLVEDLSVGEMQRIEILKVLYKGVEVLILDEPTAVLTPLEVQDLFVTLKKLRNEGKSIVLITHKLNEVMPIADRVTVLRNGKLIGTEKIENVSVNSLVNMMIGRNIVLGKHRRSKKFGNPVCNIRDLNYSENDLQILTDINITIRSGEIYGIAGVEGNGQSELVLCLTGLLSPDSMTFELNGEEVSGTAIKFIQRGIGHVPEDRRKRGLVTKMTVAENLILGYESSDNFSSNGILDWGSINQESMKQVENYQIKTPSVKSSVSELSGGNQQKIIIARVFSQEPELIICAQPTRGIDIAATDYIHSVMLDYRDRGKAILLISADLDEIKVLSDTIGVIFKGRIMDEDIADNFDDNRLGLLMTGGKNPSN